MTVLMYVYMYVLVYICMYYMYASMHGCIYDGMNVFRYVHMNVCMNI